jgi:hypothetical protein
MINNLSKVASLITSTGGQEGRLPDSQVYILTSTVGPLFPWVLHPWIQPTAQYKYLEKNYICAEHVQTFSCHHYPNNIV